MSTHQEHTAELVSFRLSPQQELLGSFETQAVSQVAAVATAAADPGALEAALARAVERHEILRTTILTPAGVRAPQQVINERLAPHWSTHVLDAGPGALAELCDAQARAGLDGQRGPLIRALLASAPNGRSILLLTAVAAVADVPSLIALAGELLAGETADAEEPIQYADYAEWRHQLLAEEDEVAVEARSHWRAEEWPARPRLLFASPDAQGAGARVPVTVDPQLAAQAAQASGTTLPVFLEAAWHALLARLTGVEELVLAHWLDGRAQEDLHGAVGPYAQAAPIRTRADAETSIAEIADQVRRGRAQAAQTQDHAAAAALGELVRAAPAAFAQIDAGASPVPIASAAPALPGVALALVALIGADGAATLELRHDRDAVPAQDAAEIALRLRLLIESAARDGAAPVARLAIVDAAERAALLEQAAGAPGPAAPAPVHKRFAEQARRTPQRPAVSGAGATLSYAELDERANRLAHHLIARGVGAGVAVGLCMERTPAMVTALLAILKAGGAYVPLNFEHPPARIADQLTRAGASVLVTEHALLERLSDVAADIVCVERDADAIDGCPAAAPELETDPDSLVYVMYTSGSTGAPKGVEVTHANLANYTDAIAARLRAPDDAEGLHFAVVSAISTDLGNTAIFPALATGGCLHLVEPAATMDGEAYAARAAQQPIDVLKITPSHLRALLGAGRPAEVLPRRYLLVGGEAFSWELAARIRELAPGCALINHYGPTETTVGASTHDVEREMREDAATVPIGTPIAGDRAYVLDASGAPVPPGVPGELVIGGAGVARGYAGDPAETAQRFVADPAAPGARAYRTGDRARRLRDGAIEFLGRVDDQVKIRGYRVEPGEIEAVLARHPKVRQAAIVVEDAAGEARLAAYLATSEEPSVEELQSHLAASLPDYMIPSSFATLDALPFTASGKIDRRALAGLAGTQTRRETAFVGPRDDLEREIAAIWCELLGLEEVGVFDDFFTLGGHSLLATQAIIRIRRAHGDIPLRALLAAPTISAVADVVRAASPAAG